MAKIKNIYVNQQSSIQFNSGLLSILHLRLTMKCSSMKILASVCCWVKNPPGEDDNEAASSMTMLRGLKMPGLLTRFLSRVKAEGRLTLVLEICKCQAQVKSRSKQGQVEV